MKRLVIAEEVEDEEVDPIVDDYSDLTEYLSKDELNDIVKQLIEGNSSMLYDYEIFENMDYIDSAPDYSDWLFEAFKLNGEKITEMFMDGIEKYYGYLDIECDIEMLIEDIISNDESLKNQFDSDIEMSYNEFTHDDLVNSKGEDEEEGLPEGAGDLVDNDDKVGDVLELSSGFDIDRGNREAPFVYINGDILIGSSSGKGSCHTDLVNEYFNTDKDSNIRTRNLKQVDGADPNMPFGVGQIADGMAFIDECHNCTKEDVAKALKSEDSFDKIYDYDYQGFEVKRLAKRKMKRMK